MLSALGLKKFFLKLKTKTSNKAEFGKNFKDVLQKPNDNWFLNILLESYPEISHQTEIR